MLSWRWPLAIAIAALVIVAALIVAWLVTRRHEVSPEAAAVYDLHEDLAGEHASAAMRRWRVWNRVGALLLAFVVIAACVLVGRPGTVDSQTERQGNRDIVLCLDVSGSTLPYDHEVIDTYRELVKHFQGERIGLSIFNSTSRTVFPLTDDYELVSQQLTHASDVLKGVESQQTIDDMSDQQYQDVSDWLDGTQNIPNATSLIGDGLVSCAAMLPGFTYSTTAQERARREASIVLATDNVVSGKETYSLAQALDLTSKANIAVEGLYSGPQSSEKDATTVDMERLIESHGGTFLRQSDATSVDALVRQINEQQVHEVELRNKAAVVDAPGWWTLALIVLVAGWMLVAWRLRR
ncbi:vWA domain-containing protein [Bifidobacterium gallicum]|uniref:von Willebrand factor A n=1 Tax=Bifidobacterium gallicum DSM 20093 = LMG 11596 TaxID=561180 RepID=D1NU80_9BIFI|nr:VWA domain-containing protein [Bifidobacterium gallicum]EFA23284.1 von Willebrand factor type A domain protein [Bifidobacterium gallicum DSM 20093 = LMG 11596]KFI58928.1 von Willebrand factor A [Bifidobacterium gallicum DSM 20093 = LMG 11596]